MIPLRFITYLVPGLPLGLFELMARAIGAEVLVDGSASGPADDGTDPFTTGEADLGMMCAPPYLAMASGALPPVVLLGLAPVFDDPRLVGRPEYFAEVVVRDDHPATCFEDLRGAVLGVNDPRSLSGFLALALLLTGRGLDHSFFGTVRETGSHDASLAMLASGAIEVTTIDSNALRLRRRAGEPTACATRVIRSLGPYPIQPLVVRSGLGPGQRRQIRQGLLELSSTPSGRRELARFGCCGFATVDASDYAQLAGLMNL